MADSGNLEVFFSYTPAPGASVVLHTDIQGRAALTARSVVLTALDISMEVEEIGDSQYALSKTILGGEVVDQSNFRLGEISTLALNIRVVVFDQYISGYCNGRCVYSYALGEADYPNSIIASLKVLGSAMTLSSIRRRELADIREALFVDYEANTEGAIQSILQQRPVEINPGVDRELAFTYFAIKDIVQAHHVSEYSDQTEDNLQLSSDGIVNYAKVGIAIDVDTAKEVGFITRLYRLSELTSGAIEAARKYQRTALQKRHSVNVSARPDPRLEQRDNLVVSLLITGTQTPIEDSIIVESINIRLEDGNYRMNVTGRKL